MIHLHLIWSDLNLFDLKNNVKGFVLHQNIKLFFYFEKNPSLALWFYCVPFVKIENLTFQNKWLGDRKLKELREFWSKDAKRSSSGIKIKLRNHSKCKYWLLPGDFLGSAALSLVLWDLWKICCDGHRVRLTDESPPAFMIITDRYSSLSNALTLQSSVSDSRMWDSWPPRPKAGPYRRTTVFQSQAFTDSSAAPLKCSFSSLLWKKSHLGSN